MGGGDDPAPERAAAGDDGGLPFTGLELALVAAFGAALLGTGLALRRSVTSR